VSKGRKNKKIIFITYILVVVIGYFTVPMLLNSLPTELKPQLSRLNVIGFPDEMVVISDREIVSYNTKDSVFTPEYLICSIDDDPDGTNAYGVYDPTDLAVTVSNLVRLDVKHLFLGTHLYWPDLSKTENNTLSSQLELLDSCILSTPLRRSAESSEMPDYLRQSSLSKEDVQGRVQLLPVVNNLSLAPTIDIPENCKVGFSQLESEAESVNIPLLAVWDDRIILSSLLLERMHQLGAELGNLEIIIGKHIKLGKTGNLIPIDEFGYFTSDKVTDKVEADIISAEITSVKKSPVDSNLGVLTASGVKADSYRAIENPIEQLNQLGYTPYIEDQVKYQRVPWWTELLLVIVVGVLLCLLAGSSTITYWICTVFLVATVYIGSAVLHAKTLLFIPILYILVALLVCLLVRSSLKKEEKPKKEEKSKKEKKVKSQKLDDKNSKVEVPKRLMTIAEKMREEETSKGESIKAGIPKEIKMLIDQLEGKKDEEEIVKNSDDFEGDFCDLTDRPKEFKEQMAKSKSNKNEQKKPDSKPK